MAEQPDDLRSTSPWAGVGALLAIVVVGAVLKGERGAIEAFSGGVALRGGGEPGTA